MQVIELNHVIMSYKCVLWCSIVSCGELTRRLCTAGGISVKDVPREATFNAKRLQVLDSENLGVSLFP